MMQSLRFRLPLIICALIAVSLVAFLFVSFQQVKRALLEAGEARALAASDQLASLLAQSSQQRLTEVRRIARDGAVRAYLDRPAETALAGARERLAALTATAQPAVELWTAAGERLLVVPPAKAEPRAPALPAIAPPIAEGVSGFQASGQSVYWDVIAQVPGEAAEAPAPGTPPRGFVVSRRLLTGAGTSEAISRLVGARAVIKVGNQAGGVWSDLAKLVAAPATEVRPGLFANDRGADGQSYMGSATAIRGTPWMVLVEFPRAAVVAPARAYLLRMLVVAGLLVLTSAIVAYALSSRITTPLHQLTQAAESIAEGNFGGPIETGRRDEVGRLAGAFQAMATEVGAARHQLEERVEERTKDIAALNSQLEARVNELKSLTSELEAFSYSVSHDLRAPLRHMGGFAALLEKSNTLDAQGQRYARTISEASARMGRLIDDLLAFSRMGRAEMLRTQVNLGALVEDVREEVSALREAGAIHWTIHPLPIVEADPAMMRQVLVNLLSNAVKYSGPRSPAIIEVGTMESPAEIVLFVRDNGVGFDMQYAGSLFGVFQRLHAPEAFEGTGIGLASVRRIAHRHGGRTWAESALDKGATFFVALPMRPSARIW
jgi:signal transduction histidine kinase